MKGKVLHLISNRWNSAITEYCLSAARALELCGYNSVIGPLADSPAAKRALSYGLTVKSFAHFGIGQILYLRSLVEELKPCAIITYGGPESFLCRFLPKGIKRFRFRGDAKSYYNASPWRLGLDFQRLDGVISPAFCLSEKLLSLKIKHPVHTIPLGVDPQAFKPNPAFASSSTLLIVGRLDPVKGHREFLPIFSELKNQASDAKLLIIGENKNLTGNEISEAAAKLGLAATDVELIEHRVENIGEYMANATIGLIPSLGSEIICRVAHEFLLCGCPIFVSGIGATGETLAFPSAGTSYQGLEPKAAAAKLSELFLSAKKENAMARLMRSAHAQSSFSLYAMGEKLANLFAD